MATRREWISGFVLAAGTALTACVVTATAQEDVAPAAGGPAPSVQPAPSAAAAPVLVPPSADRGPNNFIRYAAPSAGGIVRGGSSSFSGFGGPGAGGGFSLQSANDESDELRQARIDVAAAENDAQTTLDEYKTAKDDAAKTKLREAVQKQFELRQKYRDLEIAQLEAEVKQLRDLHEKRETAKSQIIDARLDLLVRSAEGLGWDGSESSPRSGWSAFGGGRSSFSRSPAQVGK